MSAADQQNRLLGIALRIGAATCFGFMAAMIKLGDEAGVSLPELAFYRFAFGLPPLLIWIALTGNFGAWRTERPLAHLGRGVIGLSTMVLAFAGLTFLPLAESATIGFVAPLFSVIAVGLAAERAGRAPPLERRRDRLHRRADRDAAERQRPSADRPRSRLASALGVAGVTITIRTIGRTESTPTIVLWFTLFSIAATGRCCPGSASGTTPVPGRSSPRSALFGGLGQLFLTSALRFAPVSVVVPFDYTQLLWAVLLGWLLWDTHPPATTWAGAAVIVAAGSTRFYREHKLGRDKPRPEPF